MANHAVLIPNKIAAKNIDSKVRPAISASAIDNGNIMQLNQKSGTSGEPEVWLATAPTTASAVRVWMAGAPEQPFAVAGDNVYYGLGNIQDFYTSACTVFTVFQLSVGDIVTLTSDALDSTTAAAYAISVNGKYTLEWSATAPSSGFGLRYLNTTYIPVASGSAIGSGRITAYQFEVYSI